MKNFMLAMFVLLSADICSGQSGEINHRVILTGDAGEVNVEQLTALSEAADRVIPGKTVVVFLGDNVYPKGLGLPGDRKEAVTKQVLKSQFWPMRAKDIFSANQCRELAILANSGVRTGSCISGYDPNYYGRILKTRSTRI